MPRRAALAILCCVFGLITLRCVMPVGVFWTTDAGNKFIVAQNFVLDGFRHVAIGYPAANLDPLFQWFPSGANHFRRVGAHFFSIVSFVFPLLNAPLIGAFGAAGATIIPLGSGIGILVLVPLLMRATGTESTSAFARHQPWLAIVAVAIATPIAFYSLDFWEHTTATFFATAALLLMIRQRPWLAGLATGISIALREEGYVFLFALLVAIAFSTSSRRLIGRVIAGSAAIVLPLLFVQNLVYGTPLGMHLAAHTGPDATPLAMRIARNFFYFLLQFHSSPAIAALLALPAIAVVILGAFNTAARLRVIAAAALAISAAAGVLMIAFDPQPFVNTISTQGLLLFIPCSALFFVRWREFFFRPDAAGLLARTVCIYIAVMPLVLRANWGGVVWGPRYFLTIVPELVVLTFAAWDGGRTFAAVAVASFLVSAVLEVDGLFLLHRKLEVSARMRSAIASAPDLIITDVYWLPEEMGSIFFQKKIIMPLGGDAVDRAIATAGRAGFPVVAFVTSDDFGWFSPAAKASLARAAIRRTRLASPGFSRLDLTIDELRLTPER